MVCYHLKSSKRKVSSSKIISTWKYGTRTDLIDLSENVKGQGMQQSSSQTLKRTPFSKEETSNGAFTIAQ